ncbi:MAG: anti-sigma factor [Planctomycetota bacterium]
MDCLTALEILDCARPDSDDLTLPEFADASAHLAECESCRGEFERRQQFDVEVSRIAVDVPVPASLRVTLLAAMSDSVAEFSESETESTTASNAGIPGRIARVRMIAALSACLLLAAVTVWFRQPVPSGLQIATIQSELNLNLPKVTFDASFEVVLPPSWGSNPGLQVSETLSGLDLDDRAGHDGAAAYFAYLSGRAAPIRGVLVAVPADRVTDVPAATVFSRAPVAYPQKGIVSVAWQNGDLVYLCFVPGNTAMLERVQRGMTGSAA